MRAVTKAIKEFPEKYVRRIDTKIYFSHGKAFYEDYTCCIIIPDNTFSNFNSPASESRHWSARTSVRLAISRLDVKEAVIEKTKESINKDKLTFKPLKDYFRENLHDPHSHLNKGFNLRNIRDEIDSKTYSTVSLLIRARLSQDLNRVYSPVVVRLNHIFRVSRINAFSEDFIGESIRNFVL